MNNPQTDYVDAVVIGAGIVGLAVAERLRDQGRTVLLVERERVAAAASRGNAAAFAFSEILPLASPGMIRQAMRWLIDPVGPFSVVASDLPWTLPWLWRFLAASRPSQVGDSICAQADLMALARDSMSSMVARVGLGDMISHQGALHLYQDFAAYRREQKNWALRRQHGIEYQTYEGEALHRFQPGLSDRFTAGVYAPQWQTVSDPALFCEAIHRHLSATGVETRYAEVTGIGDGDYPELSLANGDKLRAGHVVVAAGPWSGQLAARLGDQVPLIGERGYNTTFPPDALGLKRMLIFSEHGFVVTPMQTGIRVGGASEIARLSRAPNYRRCEAMVSKAKQFLPDLSTQQGEPWMGSRPALPDTLPIIGRSRRSPNILYAFGHGHLGLTQSAATGQLIGELVSGSPPSIDLKPFRVERFA